MTAGSRELEPARAPILALGLGNLLLGDDAIGLHLAGQLREQTGLEVQDGGTQGIALLAWLSNRETAIILDAVSLGAEPGTVHLLRGETLSRLRARRATSAHEGNALELLETAKLLGDGPAEVIVIGIEPKSVRTGIGLTPEVEAAIPEAMRSIHQVLAELYERKNTHVSGDPGPHSGN